MNKQILAIIAILSLAFMGCGGSKTYSISGTVFLNGVGYEGVTVTLSGNPDISTTTDSSGNYSFGDVRKGDGFIVTPSLAANGYTQTFDPFSHSIDIDKNSSSDNDFDLNVFEISGQVTMNGSGYSGVAVSVAGDTSGSETTDGSGLYTFWVLNGNYTVTASLAGQTLQPASFSPNINGVGSINNDFALDTYDIDGRVTLEGVGYQGATVTLGGDAALAFSTDAGGYYSFTVLNGTYDVTPSVTGQTLTPANYNRNIDGAGSPDNDFVLDTYNLGGTVTWNSSGYQGAEVQLAGTSLSGETYNSSDFTDTGGDYSFRVLNGSYSLTPIVSGQTLTPTGMSPVISGLDSTSNDFALNTYTISGQVILGTGGYPGATVRLSDSASSTTTTDGSGNYSFAGLLSGSYTVAPEVAGETASPAQRDIIITTADRAGNDFILGANTITGRVTLNGAGYGGVTVTLSGDSSDSDTTDSSGEYLFVVLNGTYTVTPSLASQTLTPGAISGIFINETDSVNNNFALDTNTLSGQVTLNSGGYAGVAVSLTGTTMTDSATTDGSGNYSFNVLNDTFTVTPSLSGQTLTPGSESGIVIAGSASPAHDFALDTYPITGQVTQTGDPYVGATINLTGDLTDSTTTDSGGDYTLDVLNGTYTVTPVVAGQTLTPASISSIVIASAADTGNDFAINTYTLSGQVTLNGAAFEGATIALSGDDSQATTTDASGNYSFADLANGSYTVTPTVGGQTLDPVNLSPTINDADSTDNDFTINTYTISGQVTLSGSPYASAQVALTGDSTGSTATDASGNYSFTGLVNGDYLVTPTVSGQTLSPTFTGMTITDADSTNNDFAINAYTISGQVTLNGSGYPGATVNLSDGATDSTSTDGSGNYSFAGLLNANYTVTPVVASQTLTPLDVDLTIANADTTGNDFALDTYTISGQVTLLGSGYEGATVALSGDATASTTTPVSGNYAFSGLLNGNYTLSPTVDGQSLIPANYNLDITGADLTGNDFAVSTNTISGQVYLNGSLYQGATITLSGDASMAATTDGSGNYSFPDLLNGDYTVTPTVAGQTFNPADYDINISDSSSTGNDFTINTYTISGQVTLNGSVYSGASVDLSGAGTNSTATDGSGNYSFTGLLSGDYTVTPSVLGQTLTPADRDITIGLADSTGNDFTIDTHTISGQVTLNGSAYPGATITMSGDASMAATTDGSGNYSFPDLLNGSYTVTPTVSGQTLNPANYNLNVNGASLANNDFTLNTYTISGQVTLSGSGYPGATVALSGAATASTTTPASGNYAFSGLLNGSYTVTPTVGGQALTPAVYNLNISDADSTGNDFAVSTNTISGKVTLNGSDYPGATITLSGDADDTTTTDGSGNYSFPDLLNGNYTVTPTVAGQTLDPADYDINISDSSSTGNDFAINTYTISGQVTLGVSGYSGASVALSGAATASTTTPASGNYSFTGLLSGDYTVTPSVLGQTLTPEDRNITIGLANSTGNDFAIDSYSISGQVTLNASGYSGATVALSGAADASTTTPVSGNYTFTGLLNGTYTVTPTVTDQTLTPTSISSIAISGANSTGNNFVLDTYTLSGQVTLGGSGYSGATVDLSDTVTDSTTTDGSGNYSFSGLLTGSYTVTPDVAPQSVNPASYIRTITTADWTGLDFSFNTYEISGNVSNGSGPMEWINVSLIGSSTGSARTDSSGDYTFANVLNGSYTVTPTSAPQTFSPASYPTVTVSGGDETGRDFTVPSMIWVANADATATTEDGYSWQTAYRHPQNAADIANIAGTAVGNQVWVANGPYYAYGDTTDFTVATLMLHSGFEYYGGFAGTETALSERNLEGNWTTLDGLDIAQEIVVAADNTTLNGFAVEHGLVPAYFDTYVAPVSAAEVSNFSVIDCVVANNIASTAVHSNSSGMNFGSGLILNTTFRNNWGWDGPLFVRGVGTESVDIINVTSFYNNAYYGGGMILGGEGPLRVVNSTIVNNNTTDPFSAVLDQGKGIWMHMGGSMPSRPFPPGGAKITNTIVYGDIHGHGTTVGESLPVVLYSLMESEWGATYEAIYADPTNIFASSLGNTPNFVSWAGSPVYDGNHPFQIASNSPCIDAGTDAAIPSTILVDNYGAEVDLLGNARSVDWGPTAGTGVDMGAYEFITPWEPGLP